MYSVIKAQAHLTTPFFTMDLTSVQLVPVECWTLPINYPTQSSTEVSGEGEAGKKITTVLAYRELHFSHIIYIYIHYPFTAHRGFKVHNTWKKQGHIALEVSLLHLLHLKLMLHNSQIKKKTCAILPLCAFILLNHLLNHTHALQQVTYSTSTHRIIYSQNSNASYSYEPTKKKYKHTWNTAFSFSNSSSVLTSFMMFWRLISTISIHCTISKNLKRKCKYS